MTRGTISHLERPDLEASVLGTVLTAHQSFGLVLHELAEYWDEAWTSLPRRGVAVAMRTLDLAGKPVDAVSVGHALEAQGKAGDASLRELGALVGAAESTEILAHRAAELRAVTQQRALLAALHWAESELERPVEDPDALATALAERISKAAVGKSKPIGAATAAGRVRELYAVHKRGGGMIGVPTGLGDIDAVTLGLPYGQISVLGGRPSMGKSSLAGHIVHAALLAAFPVLVINHEPSCVQFMRRLACQCGRISYLHALSGRLRTRTETRFLGELDRLSALPLTIYDDPCMTPIQCRSAILHATKFLFGGRPPLVVVDYVQYERLPGWRQDRTSEVAAISRMWTDTAKTTGAAVLLLAQLGRQAAGREPQLSDLKESGALEQDAQVVMLIHRPGVEKADQPANRVQIFLAKNRDGALATSFLHFTSYSMTFREWEAGDTEQTREEQKAAEGEELRQQGSDAAQLDLPPAAPAQEQSI